MVDQADTSRWRMRVVSLAQNLELRGYSKLSRQNCREQRSLLSEEEEIPTTACIVQKVRCTVLFSRP